jgi:hypothetical protein
MYEDRIGGKDKDKNLVTFLLMNLEMQKVVTFLLMNLEMQKVPINHAILESGDQLLSNSKSCLGNTFQFEQFTF